VITRPSGVSALAVVMLALPLAACQSDPPPSGCRLSKEVALIGTPLTLVPDARMDWIGDRFELIGYQDGTLRWAGLDVNGLESVEFGVPVPAAPAPGMGAGFAVAGRQSRADSVVVAYAVSGAAGMIDIMTAAAPSDGSAQALHVQGAVTSVPVGTPIAMTSSRTGMRAALAWPGPGVVNIQILDGQGAPVGAPIVATASGPTPQVSCVSFVPGRDALTVGYLRQVMADDHNPNWVLVEVRDDGTTDGGTSLPLGTMGPTCPVNMPSAAGYGVAWQNELGSFLGSYTQSGNNFSSALFAGSVAFGGADLQPPIVGIGPAAADTAVIFAKPNAAEAWRVDSAGNLSEATLVFPSAEGNLGQVSAVPVSGALYATYADYTGGTSAGPTSAGQRFFVKVSCF